MKYGKKLINLLHFHRKQVLVGGVFVGCYATTCYKTRTFNNEIIRMGIAGSIANLVCECAFHAIDTVNIRAKARTDSISTMSMMSKIWAKEGVYGFSKGFTACFYGGAACGFMYFALYKWFKGKFKELFGENTIDMAFIFLLSSFAAEMVTLSVQYPYDLIKCRLQSVNYLFKY